MKIEILAMCQGFDVVISDDVNTPIEALEFIKAVQQVGEFTPRPRYQKSGAEFSPFYGVVESTEIGGKTKGGKEYYIAQVRPDVAEGEAAKDLYAVKYFDKQNLWRKGDAVYVHKDDKGYVVITEKAGDPPF